MILTPSIIEFIINSDSKALATSGPNGLNVVPVSTLRIVNGKILLMNYFMKKSLANILENPYVALVCWKDLSGYQIKGSTTYLEEGPEFEESAKWVTENLTDRVLKGLIVLEPQEIFDIAPKL